MDLITGFDVDVLFKWPHGRAERLARRGELPFYSLPDGSIRFARSEVEGLVCRGGADGQCVPDVDQPAVPEPSLEDQAAELAVAGGVHQPGIGMSAHVEERGGRNMIYEVHFKDGSVGEVEASSKAAARRRAQDFSDEPIDMIVELADTEEVDDEADEADEDLDEEEMDDGDLDQDDDEEDD